MKKKAIKRRQPGFRDSGKSRRDFFKTIWKGLGVLAVIEFGAVVIAFLRPRKQSATRSAQPRFLIAGKVEDFVPGSVTSFRNGFLYLVRLKDGGFLAMSLRCPHLGCSVEWNGEKQQFVCPCHHSRFDKCGNVVTPPATRALALHPVVIEQRVVKVNLTKKIRRKRFQPSQVMYG